MAAASAQPAAQNQRRRLLANVVAGAGQAFVSGVVLFVLYRILLGRLGTEQIGAWSLLMAWFALPRLADLGLPGGMVRFGAAASAAGDTERVLAVLTRGVLVACVLTALGSGITAIALDAYAPAFLVHQPNVGRLLMLGGLVAWLSCVAVVVRAGLDALQRVDLRHGTLVLQNVLLLCGVCLLVEDGGLEGLLVAQALASGTAVAVTSWMLLRELHRRRGQVVPDIKREIQSGVMRPLLTYGLPFQVTTITGFLIEPLVKLMLGQNAGLTSVAWYEMASRMIGQARAVAVNALEALVPHVAAFSNAERRSKLVDDYRRSFTLNLAFATLGISLFLANLPLIGWLWIGYDEPLFLSFAALLTLGWWVTALAVPAYFVAQGIGVQRWNVLAHATIAVANVLFAMVLGTWWGSFGVIGGCVLATVIGNAVVILGLQREMRGITGQAVIAVIPSGYLLVVGLAILPLVYVWQWSPSRPVLLLISLAVTLVVVVANGSVGGGWRHLAWIMDRLRMRSTGRRVDAEYGDGITRRHDGA
jgi:O-antigen/teichoic acid export membrane protein